MINPSGAIGEVAVGVRVLVSSHLSGAAAIGEIASQARVGTEIAFLLIFVTPTYAPEDIAEGLARHLGDIPHAGCSTAGIIALGRSIQSGIVALTFPRATFHVTSSALFSLKDFDPGEGANAIQDLMRQLPASEGKRDEGAFVLTLLDGLSAREEEVLATLIKVTGAMPIVGGSSGDNLCFRDTFAFKDGQVARGTGLTILVRTALPFRAFKSDKFTPSNEKLIVTACDTSRRIVFELNGEPAAIAYARAIGISPASLNDLAYADHPLLVQIDGEFFCRSIQRVNEDGSLVFYSAVEIGLIFVIGKVTDTIGCLEQSLQSLEAELGNVDFVLGFGCVQTRLEVGRSEREASLLELFARYRTAGFWTYGEQYNGLHLNYTFTGLAFGCTGGGNE